MKLRNIILGIIVFQLLTLLFVQAEKTEDELVIEEIIAHNKALLPEEKPFVKEQPIEKKHYFYQLLFVPDTVYAEDYYLIEEQVDEIYGFLRQDDKQAYVVRVNENNLDKLLEKSFILEARAYASSAHVDPLSDYEEELHARIILFSKDDMENFLEEIEEYVSISSYEDKSIEISADAQTLNELAAKDGVMWVEEIREIVPFNDESVINSGVAQSRNDHALYGQGEIIAVTDSGLDTGISATLHQDFQGRIISITDISPSSLSTSAADYNGHGTHVTGTVLGNGIGSGSIPGSNLYTGSYAGIAPKASLIFQSIGIDSGINTFFPPALYTGVLQPAYNQGAKVLTNSWGIAIPSLYGFYSADAQAIDFFVWNNKDAVILYAVGNDGYNASTQQGNPDTIAPHAVAKNAISIGGHNNPHPSVLSGAGTVNDIYSASGRGPTNDGRIKPDLLAPASPVISTKSFAASFMCSYSGPPWNLGSSYSVCGGTSMATPAVAGMASLLREYYTSRQGMTNPSAALIKATLITSADDMGMTVPNNDIGWGRVNFTQAISTTEQSVTYFDVTAGLSTGNSWSGWTLVGDNKPFVASLVWSDKEAFVASSPNLINDLDFVVIDPAGNEYNGNDLVAPYNDTIDILNNVEQVRIENPIAGAYELRVMGKNIPIPGQEFAVVTRQENVSQPSFTVQGTPQHGQQINFDVNYPEGADLSYIVAFALSTSPGIGLLDGREIQLTPDLVFAYSTQTPWILGITNNVGTLDANGQTTVTWDIPNSASLVGLTGYAAVAVINFTNTANPVLSFSEPLGVTIV